jgi:ERCC4-type nuclease
MIHIKYFSLIFFFFYFLAHDTNLKIEAILDYIVERKRLDDLSKSIIDGRYNEQKVDLYK